MPPLRIALPIYPQVDMIDVAATVDPLGRIPDFSPLTLELHLAAEKLDPILTGQGIRITPTKTFADYAKDATPLDVLLLPGAADTSGATTDKTFMDFVRAQGQTARMVTSVCTGALILGAAGLLNGFRATTHWAAIDGLRAMKGVHVVNGYPRWVHDRNRLPAGGVSSSLDATLYLISLLAGEPAAKCIQLVVQYNPKPPFHDGDPSIADPDTYLRVMYGAGA